MTLVSERYRALVAAGELRPDPDQEKAVALLDRLAERVQHRSRRLDPLHVNVAKRLRRDHQHQQDEGRDLETAHA